MRAEEVTRDRYRCHPSFDRSKHSRTERDGGERRHLYLASNYERRVGVL